MCFSRYFIIAVLIAAPCRVCGEGLLENNSNNSSLVEVLIESPSALITGRVRESYEFYGLASYYNKVNYYIINRNSIRKIEVDKRIVLEQEQWLAVVGRLNVLVIRAPGLLASLSESKLTISTPEVLRRPGAVIKILLKSELRSIAIELDQIRYAQLVVGLSWLAKLVEATLMAIHDRIVGNWGVTIILFSMLLKVLLLPVGKLTVHFQRSVSQVQSKLEPLLAEIKANYKGEEAHQRMMEAHKELGVSPFYTLKPMVSVFIQVPVWIAVFNSLGEMAQLEGHSFLWIDEIAYPDTVADLHIAIPLLGQSVSLLPLIMTIVTLFSAAIIRNCYVSESELKRQKRSLYLMALAFFFLFYPFPAGMVLYWTVSNFFQIIQQQLVKV